MLAHFLPNISLDLDRIVDISSIAASVATAGGLIYAGRQLRHSRSVATTDALLSLDGLLERFDEIQIKLSRKEKLTTEDFREVALYMGLMERINVMVDQGIVDIDTVNRLYGFRIRTIVENPGIQQWIKEKKHNWQDFIKLSQAIDEHQPATLSKQEKHHGTASDDAGVIRE